MYNVCIVNLVLRTSLDSTYSDTLETFDIFDIFFDGGENVLGTLDLLVLMKNSYPALTYITSYCTTVHSIAFIRLDY
jgi:hypothetical protein